MYVFFGSEMSPSVGRSVGRSVCWSVVWFTFMILSEHLFYLDWSCDAARGSNKTREKNIINYTIFARRLLGQFPISFYILYQLRTEDTSRPHKYLINSYLWQFFLYSLFNRALCTPSPETLNFCLVFGIHSNFHSLWAVGWLVGGLVGRKFCWGPFLLCYLSPTIISVRRTLWKYLRRLLTAAAWRILNRQINNSNWINKYQYDHEFECKKAYSKEKKKIVLH